MKPVEQTVLMPPGGNCFAACMASILELPLDAVPHFEEDDWVIRWNEWLRPRNLAIMVCTLPEDENLQRRYRETCMPGFTIPGADSPRGPWQHAVVAFDGELVWDPHPQREMGVGTWRDVAYFYVIDPSKLIGNEQIGFAEFAHAHDRIYGE
jgi:hypothetical protein